MSSPQATARPFKRNRTHAPAADWRDRDGLRGGDKAGPRAGAARRARAPKRKRGESAGVSEGRRPPWEEEEGDVEEEWRRDAAIPEDDLAFMRGGLRQGHPVERPVARLQARVDAAPAPAPAPVQCPVCGEHALSLSGTSLWCACGTALDVGAGVCMETVRARLHAVDQAHAARCRGAPVFALREQFGTFLWVSCGACGLDEVVL